MSTPSGSPTLGDVVDLARQLAGDDEASGASLRQRARAVWAWLRAQESTADQRPALVKKFLKAYAGGDQFPDERELLAPVMDGAGILYVVDGSVPYGPEYDAEMEILRWTGQPRLALINPIGAADHIEAWRTALGQYFSVVRVFNAVTADFQKRVELLRAFGQLKDEWRAPLQAATDRLLADRQRRREAAAPKAPPPRPG